MAFLTEWVTNIILFILLALVVDMLLPNSSMKKYTKLVMSLLLMVIIITPIFRLFSYDLPQSITDMNIPSLEQNQQIKNEMELKKKEIQTSKHAYILEQMAVQMESVAEEELIGKYGLGIKSIVLSTNVKEMDIQSEKDLEKIVVTIAKRSGEEADETIETIQPIKVEPIIREEEEHEKLQNEADVIKELAHIWGVSTDKISIQLEGGEGER
ncbi:stage III sporulation protein AF [Bacillus sp. FJAT-47783]|uniref:stage III sporulation protein AF n=1 Tax=Bacillus sp. FJAT-47783 TaxID=2922712 RepID=UPI001FAC850F|nr:stage III sporulation protein AF [Bacillus sp. FJAT-47783]